VFLQIQKHWLSYQQAGVRDLEFPSPIISGVDYSITAT
jgi:hypothetical protein